MTFSCFLKVSNSKGDLRQHVCKEQWGARGIMKRWYVIHTKPHSEDTVCRLLSQAQVETYLPKVEHYMRLRRAQFFRPGPLFPSYCFCHANLSVSQNYNLIRYTRGVLRILGTPQPVSVSNDVIAMLKTRVNTGTIADIVAFRPGNRLKVRRGVLKNLEGILEKPVGPDGRVNVLIKLLNYTMKTTLHWSEVERVQTRTAAGG